MWARAAATRCWLSVDFQPWLSQRKIRRISSGRTTLASASVCQDLDDANGVGLSNPHITYGGRRKMLDLVNKLHSTGVQVDLDLPQIAVIGSQSAGKSSLIESISGVTLPRASGTITRCPTECRLSRTDSPWQCIVSLKFITDSSGQPRGKAHTEQFGPIIRNRAEVEDRIRRAQRAILNPQRPQKYFLGNGEDHLLEPDQLSFSQNSVTLQISGPDVADLSFCDLPGLIASVSSDRGSGYDIALVQNLVTSYIKKPSCIILLTVACETDFENQGAHHLAKKHDPDGKRTIGVLTKPDHIPCGEELNWISFIKNERESLEHNWFSVKQPSSAQLEAGITWVEARTSENTWFVSNAPWCDLDDQHQKFLRTANLVEKLSIVLSDLVAKRLPQIQEELEKSIISCRLRLSQLPSASFDPRTEIAALLHEFTSDLSRHVAGIADDSESTFGEGIGLIQAIRPEQERFRLAIRATAPEFLPFEKKDAGKKTLPVAAFLVSEEGDGGREKGSNLESQIDKEPPGPEDGKMISKKKVRSDNFIYIDEVRDRAYRARTRELPGNYPFIVQKKYIERIVKQWDTPAKVLCKTVHSIVLEDANHLISKHFAKFGIGHLEQRVASIVQQHMRQCLERAEERIEWLLDLEAIPFSLNTHYLAAYQAKFLAHYRASRRKYEKSDLTNGIEQYQRTSILTSVTTVNGHSSTTAVQPTGIAKILAGLAEVGMTGIKAEDLGKLLPPDPTEPALVIMADVRAYFQVAYKRFADVIPLAVDREIVRGVECDILAILYSNLAINGPDGAKICQEFARENPQIAKRRADLQSKLKRLEKAGEELRSIAN